MSDARPGFRAFDGLAATYAAHRPSYPSAIIDALVAPIGGPAPAQALDVGCGTGISTRLLAERGLAVVGIDPNADMLAMARAAGPATIEYRIGSAERTGCADASIDLVLAAQAFHWFAPSAALAEFARILRPGGRVALLWNLRVHDGGFTDAYGQIVAAAGAHVDPSQRAAREALDAALLASDRFEGVTRIEAANDIALDEESAIGRATSASYFPRTEPARAEAITALRDAFRRFAHDGRAILRHVARCTIATRR